MRAHEFIPENRYEDAYRQQWQQFQPDGEEQRAGMVLRWQQVRPNRVLVQALSGDGSRELGSVQFHRYDPTSPKWTGEALHVDQRYRRQGVATAMYDWFRQKFGPIRPSDAQTRDGESFWQRKKVWEQGVAEGLNEMDKSAPQPGRDGKVSHSTYGSRDKKGSDYFKGKEAPDKPVTAKQMSKDALDILKKQGVVEGTEEINWVKPNFDFEWHEVEEQSKMKQVPIEVRQYYQKHFPNKKAWLKSVQNGKVVVVNPDHNFEIRNAPHDKQSLLQVLAPTGHEGPIGPAKAKRVNALFDKGGPIEMPIILKTNKGLWLIGGKTRLGTANYIKGIPAKVWMIGGEQGVREGSKP